MRDNGFVIRYTHPNLLFISWKHWVPSYVRSEIKKKTGKQVDEYGKLVKKEEDDKREDNNYNNLILNNNNKSKSDKSKSDYKDIKSYNPSGNLIYSNNLLKKLDINN